MTKKLQWTFLLSLSWLSLACGAAQVDLAQTNKVTVFTVPSPTHELYAVHILQKDRDLVLYGRIRKIGGFCIAPGHIDVLVMGKDDAVLSDFSLPIEHHGKKRSGWNGANYRARVPFKVPEGAVIRLAFHGEQCHLGTTFRVNNNYAMPKK